MRVAAIQMTSGPDIEVNLEVAGRFIAEAARQGAVLAALPENFAFMGLDSGDKRAIAEPDGSGKIQNFLADTARRHKIWVVGGTVPLRQDTDGRVTASSLVYKSDGQRAARLFGAARQAWHALIAPQFGAPDLVRIREEAERQAREAIDDQRYEAAFAEGLAMTVDEAIRYALEK